MDKCKSMKIIFAGTPEFAVPALEHLIESPHKIVAVITQPDRPVGRGRKILASPVKLLAQKHAIPVLQPEKLRQPPFAEELRPYKPDLMVVAAYGKILPKEMLELPRFGCVNIHASLLPRYRGAAPINRAIMNGDHETGVTLMKMDETLDTGEILMTDKVDILEDDDVLSLWNILSVVGASLLMRLLEDLEQTGELKGIPQDETLASFAPKITKEDCIIDWSGSMDQVLCRIRGLSPEPGAVAQLRNKIIKILQAEPYFSDKEEYEKPILAKKEFRPGGVIHLVKNWGPVIRTGDGLVVLKLIQLPGKRPISGVDLMNGGHIKIGDQLTTSS